MSLIKQLNTGNVQIVQGQSGCCPDAADAVCKHTFVITDLASITSITIDGNVHTITATDETDPGDIKAAIEQAFYDEGYVHAHDKEMIPDVTVYKNIWEDTSTAILIYTNATSVELTTVPASDPVIVACIKTVACRYHIDVPVGAVSFELSDAEVEASDPANSPVTVDGAFTTGNANLFAAELETELIALYAGTDNVTVKRVRVIEDVANAMYSVDFWLYGRHPIITNDVDMPVEPCECKVDYTTANA